MRAVPGFSLTLPHGVQPSWSLAGYSADGAKLYAGGPVFSHRKEEDHWRFATWDRSGALLTTFNPSARNRLRGVSARADRFVFSRTQFQIPRGESDQLESLDETGTVLNAIPG